MDTVRWVVADGLAVAREAARDHAQVGEQRVAQLAARRAVVAGAWVVNPAVWHELHMGCQPRVRRCGKNSAPKIAYIRAVLRTGRIGNHCFDLPYWRCTFSWTSLDSVVNHQSSFNFGSPEVSISFHIVIARRCTVFNSFPYSSGANGFPFLSTLVTFSPLIVRFFSPFASTYVTWYALRLGMNKIFFSASPFES